MGLLLITCMMSQRCLFLSLLRLVLLLYFLRISFPFLYGGLYFEYFKQIYGDDSAVPRDCFKMFNPVDTATFKVCKYW